MRYKKFLFPEQHKKNLWFKLTWKWFKIILGTFLLMSTLWGCGQMIADSKIATAAIKSVYDNKDHNVAAIFFELLVGNSDVAKNHVIHITEHGIFEYKFRGISTWSQVWTEIKSPFYGVFVYPIAWLLINISSGLNVAHDPKNPVSIIFAIIFTTLIIKFITLVFTFKVQQSQQKMQAVQIKTAEIQAKYKHSRDPSAKQKQQMELMAIYKKEGINPIAVFIPVILSLPFLTAMFTVMRSTNVLKNTQVGAIKLLEQPWSMIIDGNYIYLIIIAVYLPIQLVSVLLPMILNRSTQKKIKTKESKAALKKQVIVQSISFFVYIFSVFFSPSGLGIYWIISAILQIMQTIGFYYYNKYKRNSYKRNGSFNIPFLNKVKKIFVRSETVQPKKIQ